MLEKPYFIAEIGVNHGGSIKLAKDQIDLAIEGGADCVKFQMYKAEDLAIKNSPAYWDLSKEKIDSQFLLFSQFDRLNFEDYKDLSDYSRNKGADFMVTPFSIEGVKEAAAISDIIKIASADITNIPLLREVSRVGLPAIISTGAASFNEIECAIDELTSINDIDITILHCVLNYPTSKENAYLSRIKILKSKFKNYPVGYSDHVPPQESNLTLKMAVLYGAKVIEKHFTHDKNLPGNDHYHAFDKNDLKEFIDSFNEMNALNGKNFDELEFLSIQEPAIKNARRSIVSTVDIKKGQTFSMNNITTKRPGTGIPSSDWDKVIGRKAISNIKQDELIKYSDIEQT